MFLSDKNKQSGVSVYFIFIVLMIIFSSFLILSNLILIRFQTVKSVGDSVVAFYVADAGVEKVLYEIKLSKESEFPLALPVYNGSLPGASSYNVTLRCRYGFDGCNSFCEECVSSHDCRAPRFCILSKGSFKQTKRAIEAQY